MAARIPKSSDFHGISIQVDIYIKPNEFEEYLRVFKPFYDKITQENELTYFEVFQEGMDQQEGDGDPGHIRFIECFSKDRDWFLNEFRKRDYIQEYEKATKHFWIAPRSWLIYDRLAPEWRYW